MKKRIIFASLIVAFVLCTAANAVTYDSEVDEIAQSVLRLHVIANRDYAKDQAIKLKVVT